MKKTLAGLKRKGTLQKWKEENGDLLVRIWSNQWSLYWCPDRSGYTRNIANAGVYTLRDAINASGHCGSEKGIVYEFVSSDLKPTQEERGAAKLLLSIVS